MFCFCLCSKRTSPRRQVLYAADHYRTSTRARRVAPLRSDAPSFLLAAPDDDFMRVRVRPAAGG
jgi:hypothetical protein